jgi:hypothetical protein
MFNISIQHFIYILGGIIENSINFVERLDL